MEGWIKLHRELKDKSIWLKSTPEQKTILITLLMMVNHKPKKWEWKGQQFEVQCGQRITSLEGIVNECGKGITTQNVRSALKRFEKLGFLTNESTKTGRLITIVKWLDYQIEETKPNKETNKEVTKTQQRANKELTPNKNVRSKECKNVKNDDVSASAEIFNFYNNNFGLITNFEAESIGTFLDDGVEVALIIKAMQIAIENKVRNWGYVKKILQNKLDAGVKTIEQFNQFEKERELKKEKKTLKFNKVDQLHNFDQRHYEEEDLEQYYS